MVKEILYFLRMKRIFLYILITLFSCYISILSAQTYQLPNADFETWDSLAVQSEPSNWNSFQTAQCMLPIGCAMAMKPHHYRVDGGRPGSAGNYYLTLYSNNIMGVIANGNITLGQINLGSISSSSPDNYNFTNRAKTEHYQVFTANPDSLYIWIKYYAADSLSKARIAAYIHGDNDFKDPNDINSESAYASKATLECNRTGSSAETAVWVQKRIDFVKNGTSDRNYILITLTNNSIPASGEAGDSLSVDDIELIYSAWLHKIKVNDKTIAAFNTSQLEYNRYYQLGTDPDIMPTLTIVPESSTAQVHIDTVLGPNNDIDSAKTIITVTAEDGNSQRIYIINHYISETLLGNNAKLKSIMVDGDLIPDFNPDTYTYQYVYNYERMPLIRVELEDSNASYDIIPLMDMPGQSIINVVAEDGETVLSYCINFSSGVKVEKFLSVSDNLFLYPNPTNNHIQLMISNPEIKIDNVSIYDFCGKLIKTQPMKDANMPIDVSTLSQGVYIMKVNQGVETVKIFKFLKY
jgi:hypothetical protein